MRKTGLIQTPPGTGDVDCADYVNQGYILPGRCRSWNGDLICSTCEGFWLALPRDPQGTATQNVLATHKVRVYHGQWFSYPPPPHPTPRPSLPNTSVPWSVVFICSVSPPAPPLPPRGTNLRFSGDWVVLRLEPECAVPVPGCRTHVQRAVPFDPWLRSIRTHRGQIPLLLQLQL